MSALSDRPAFAAWLGETNDVTRMFLAASQIPDLINLAGGLPEASLYPNVRLADLARDVLLEQGNDALSYPPIEGLADLRDLIAERFSSAALKLTRDNVLIVSGGMQGLDLVGKALLEEGQMIACQSPAYLGAIDAWRPRRPAYRPIFPDRNDYEPLSSFQGVQFAYMVPNFSNPTGWLVDENQRRRTVEAAHKTGCWLVEDDPYGALYYDGDPVPRMLDISAEDAGSPYDGPVIHMGTLSKEVAPGLRVGWVIAAPEMIAQLTIVKQGSDMCTSGLSQCLAIAAFRSGLTDEILPDILDTYRARRDALCEALDTHLSDRYDWVKPVGGMFVWAVAKNPKTDTTTLLDHALAHKVCISPSSAFDPLGEYSRAIRLNFTLNPPEKLHEGVSRLARAVAAYEAEVG